MSSSWWVRSLILVIGHHSICSKGCWLCPWVLEETCKKSTRAVALCPIWRKLSVVLKEKKDGEPGDSPVYFISRRCEHWPVAHEDADLWASVHCERDERVGPQHRRLGTSDRLCIRIWWVDTPEHQHWTQASVWAGTTPPPTPRCPWSSSTADWRSAAPDGSRAHRGSCECGSKAQKPKPAFQAVWVPAVKMPSPRRF